MKCTFLWFWVRKSVRVKHKARATCGNMNGAQTLMNIKKYSSTISVSKGDCHIRQRRARNVPRRSKSDSRSEAMAWQNAKEQDPNCGSCRESPQTKMGSHPHWGLERQRQEARHWWSIDRQREQLKEENAKFSISTYYKLLKVNCSVHLGLVIIVFIFLSKSYVCLLKELKERTHVL